MPSAAPTRKKSLVYIDGFNLYYGTLINSQFKWLNLERYFTTIRPADDILGIRYFTAEITGSHRPNQLAYLRAISTLPLVEIILGRFKPKPVICRVSSCSHAGSRKFYVPEEKRTDVNIAVRMLDDAYQEPAERFIVVSGDSDLVPAVNALKTRFPTKQVIVYVPACNPVRAAATELRNVADKHRTLPREKLKMAQFPARVPDGRGGYICKPASW